MINASSVLEVIQSLKVGEGFEAGDLFPKLPSEEKVFWQLVSIKGGTYKFKLYYRSIFLRNETLHNKSGEATASV